MKMSARIVRHTGYLTFEMTKVAIPMVLFEQILARIARLIPLCYKKFIFLRVSRDRGQFGGQLEWCAPRHYTAAVDASFYRAVHMSHTVETRVYPPGGMDGQTVLNRRQRIKQKTLAERRRLFY